MRNEAIQLEEQRLQYVNDVTDYQAIHERHRIFPTIFEDRRHARIIDIAAGVGVIGKKIMDEYPADLLCNDICPKCLNTMGKSGLATVSFDIDAKEEHFPLQDGQFDAVIALATIEHLINIDHFMKEIHRILRDGGHLYISAPNYSGITYLLPFLLTGKTFHDPLNEDSRYEFYGHVRYFTYHTLLDYVGSFGFVPETVYLPLPKSSSRYQSLLRQSKIKAVLFKNLMNIAYRLSPRWAADPIICFNKRVGGTNGKLRKMIL